MVSAVLDEPAQAQPVQAAIDKAGAAGNGVRLTIDQVSHHFTLRDQVLPVLSRVSLTAEPGEFVALLGPSGCGKSTLLRLVAGLEPPRRGTLAVDGVTIGGPDPSRVVVFQDPTLYPWRTVWDNAALGLEARGLLGSQHARVDDALARVGLTDFARAYPRQLSGGMAQRAALARALVNEPRLLILDEPLGKLDSLTRLSMQGELVALWQRSRFTALLVTHDVEEALLLATRVIVFSERPARITAELRIDRDYPRHRDDPELIRLRREILGLLGLGQGW
ncbi:ABC transporter ATP-binding protein [Cupriavidus basilensis]|uniref:ABC transporter ATP-binding protein n=1 Tax=unclassified Cupriavidus TaxID=2640874 RepID=UPI00044F18C2|nr:ABC transporter ATP-binding protein [Cupriavidus sp. SK-3]KDP86495.1 ABC transporter [Cupriavidus sp. SK-3]